NDSSNLNNKSLIDITISPIGNSLISHNKTQQYTATANYSDGSSENITSLVTWNSLNESVAKIESNGLATVVGKSGSTKIKATYAGKVSIQSLTLSVALAKVVDVKITPLITEVSKGLKERYNAIAIYDNGESSQITSEVTWSSSNESIATVESDGLATVISPSGTTQINATYAGVMSSESATLTATSAKVTNIIISPESATIKSGQTQQYTVTAIYNNGESGEVTDGVTWNYSNINVATIDANYIATPLTVGTTNITAEYQGKTSTQVVSLNTQMIYAYINNKEGNTVSKCIVNADDGSLSNCVDSSYPFSGPMGIAINNQYAYITNLGNSTITKCAINSTDGGLINCANSGATIGTSRSPFGIAINNSYAYITENDDHPNDHIIKCVINSTNGDLSDCTNSGAGSPVFTVPMQIAINNNHVYIGNDASEGFLTKYTVNKCDISLINGSLNNCIDSGAESTFFAAGVHGMAINNNYVYVNYKDKQHPITKCTINSDATFSNCMDSGAQSANFTDSKQIAIYNNYVYISDSNNSVVIQCMINNTDGSLSNCMDSGVGTSVFKSPRSIAFTLLM
ncbi:MAG: Ig-like domain-containing protein, partial [Burkholderiales bacterium]|nr:Ig-like domain-containing protein [Burkholderiales bacterium]